MYLLFIHNKVKIEQTKVYRNIGESNMAITNLSNNFRLQ